MTQVIAHASRTHHGLLAFVVPPAPGSTSIKLGFSAPFGVHLDEDSLVEVALMGRPHSFWLENSSGNEAPKQAVPDGLARFEGLSWKLTAGVVSRAKMHLQSQLDEKAARFVASEPRTTLFKFKQSMRPVPPRSAKRKSLAVRRGAKIDLPRPIYPAEVLYSCSPKHEGVSFLTDRMHTDMHFALMENLYADAPQTWSSPAMLESLRARLLMRTTRRYDGADDFPFVSMRYGRQAFSAN